MQNLVFKRYFCGYMRGLGMYSLSENVEKAANIIAADAKNQGLIDDIKNGKERAIVICGPTGVGKSAVAQSVASILDGEIVSADSMQIYRGMDIGTAKVLPSKRNCEYYCIDIIDPGDTYSASEYQDDARKAIAQITAEKKIPIVCGGTGLYIKAALDKMDFPKGEQVDNPVRKKYEEYANKFGEYALHDLLKEKDPKSAELIHPHNVRRCVRAFEMLSDGKSYAQQVSGIKTVVPYINSLYYGLTMETSNLYPAINTRVDCMIKEGLLDEVGGLIKLGYRDAMTSMQAIGYKELLDIFDDSGEIIDMQGEAFDGKLEDVISLVKQRTRQYSKRQRSWFRRETRIKWLWMDSEDEQLKRGTT